MVVVQSLAAAREVLRNASHHSWDALVSYESRRDLWYYDALTELKEKMGSAEKLHFFESTGHRVAPTVNGKRAPCLGQSLVAQMGVCFR